MAARLHQRFPALTPTLPRVAFCDLPTPVRELPRLGLWMKDDSRTGPLWGGNKPRKLEWVFGDARRRGKGTILTFGALGTNHGLATALYGREQGLRVVLALTDQPVDDHVRAQLARIEASGATIERVRSMPRAAATLPWLMAKHRLPYVLPPGGSSPVGALGFVEAALELADQVRAGELPEPAAVYAALGSGGTAAGLLVGLRLAGLRTRVLPVHVNDQLRLSEATVLRLAERTVKLLRDRGADVPDLRLGVGSVEVVRGFLGAGYGHATPESAAAIARARAEEGVTLDPVYTAKAMAAALARSAQPGAPQPALYWHTYNAVVPPA